MVARFRRTTLRSALSIGFGMRSLDLLGRHEDFLGLLLCLGDSSLVFGFCV